MALKIKAKKSKGLEEGKHNGEIVSVGVKEKMTEDGFDYIRVEVQPDEDCGFNIDYDCPMNLSKKSRLGKLVLQFDNTIDFDAEEEVDVEKILKGQRVSFITQNERSPSGGVFSRIVEDSIKPAE